MHARAHAFAHARTHPPTHPRTHAPARPRTHVRTHARTPPPAPRRELIQHAAVVAPVISARGAPSGSGFKQLLAYVQLTPGAASEAARLDAVGGAAGGQDEGRADGSGVRFLKGPPRTALSMHCERLLPAHMRPVMACTVHYSSLCDSYPECVLGGSLRRRCSSPQ